MAIKKINYNSKISACMHRPVTNNNKYVLYSKLTDYKGESEGSTLAEKDPEYIQKSKMYSNSPTNIRKVFITGKGVYTVLYHNVEVPKNKNTMSVIEKNFEETNMFETANKILEYAMYMNNNFNTSLASMGKALGEKEPDQYIVEGNILGVLSNPYTCNNIEEIYFDWTVLLSKDPLIRQCFGDELINYGAIQGFIDKKYDFTEKDMSNQLGNLVTATCMGNVKDIRKRFPRLKMVAMISNLEDIINAIGASSLRDTIDNEISYLNANKEKRKNITWYQQNKQLIMQSRSICLVGCIKGYSSETFEVKDTQYRFDKEYLKPRVNSLITKIKEIEKRARYGNVNINKDDNSSEESVGTIEENEQLLLNLEKSYGEEYVKSILAIASIGETKASLLQFFTDFTKPNRLKFLKMLGL